MRTNWKMTGFAIAMLVVSQSVRAEEGRPSQAALEQMGLGGLAVISDEEGMSVRGHGYNHGSTHSSVNVFGNSFATIQTPLGDAHSENGYAASGKHYASGKNGSWAGVKIVTSHGTPGHGRPGHGGAATTVKSIKFFAGGYSSASAF